MKSESLLAALAIALALPASCMLLERWDVKVAFDVYEPTHYHLYAQTAALASQYFREGNIADYMRVPELLRNAL